MPSSSGPRWIIAEAMRRTVSTLAARAPGSMVMPTMPHIGKLVAPSWQVFHEPRPEPVRNGQRQPLPGGHRKPVFRIRRVQLRQVAAAREPIVPVQLHRLGPPLLLEAEGAAVGRGA